MDLMTVAVAFTAGVFAGAACTHLRVRKQIARVRASAKESSHD